jgi:hypothetical protein
MDTGATKTKIGGDRNEDMYLYCYRQLLPPKRFVFGPEQVTQNNLNSAFSPISNSELYQSAYGKVLALKNLYEV